MKPRVATTIGIAIELLRKYTVHLTMRNLMLIFMIALLPLRGWAADAMTASMAAQQLIAIEKIASQVQDVWANDLFDAETRADMPADCAMQAAHTRGDGFSQAGHGCTTCQLCMAVVTGYATLLISTRPLPQAVQRLDPTSFTSAERAPGFKPPIS